MLAVLEEVGYEARGFADAEGLYTALEQEGVSPDLLVLDQRLPDEFGSEIVHSLRERPQYRDIPVVFVTAIDDEEADRLVELAPVLRKPFDFTEFVEIVRSNLPEPDDAPEAG
jgi:DNA-binding response OmpR family regulator